MWEDAFRVCEEYCPNKLDELKYEYSGTGKPNPGIEGLLDQATRWEKKGQYKEAIDAYLKITPSDTIDLERTTKYWLKVKHTFYK